MLAHEIINGGRIGDIRQVKVSFRNNYDYDPDRLVPWRWRFSQEEAGAGALADLGSHVFDLALHLAVSDRARLRHDHNVRRRARRPGPVVARCPPRHRQRRRLRRAGRVRQRRHRHHGREPGIVRQSG